MDRDIAASLARVSALAYEDADTVRAALPSADVALLDIDETQAYQVVWPGGVAAVAFRGTQVTANWSWADIKSNILQGRRRWLGGDDQEVHGGYHDAVMVALPEIRKFVAERLRRESRVYLTGHSLGGALATLAASALEATATYTFGAPRAGNKAFAAGLAGKNVYRFVHGLDIAPSYPHPLLGYRHGGERWQLGSDGALNLGGGWRDLFHFPVATGVLDHRVANYGDGLALPRHNRRQDI